MDEYKKKQNKHALIQKITDWLDDDSNPHALLTIRKDKEGKVKRVTAHNENDWHFTI